MANFSEAAWAAQQGRNNALINSTSYLKGDAVSTVLPLAIDITTKTCLSDDEELGLQALEIEAARIAIKSLASLAEIGEVDHLGGGLDLMSALNLSVAVSDFEKIEYTIENAHCSIGYYGILAALGYVSEEKVVKEFRRGIDIPGHVSWVPGGTQLNGGRLGVMIPTAVGQALAKKARHGKGSWVICHTGDAGWISGHALNGFNVADLHKAPITFVMHRNGIQLSGSNKQIMDKDPRPIIAAMGIKIIEVSSLHDHGALYAAYREAYELAQKGVPTMIYPVGYASTVSGVEDLNVFAARYGIEKETAAFAASKGVAMDTKIWTPGSLMSYRDIECMLECVFLVNGLPGGKGHHDGSMKGRKAADVLANPMMTRSAEQDEALAALRKKTPAKVTTKARPAPGTPNLVLSKADRAKVELPGAGKGDSCRTGSEKGYQAIAKAFPNDVFIVSCDLDPSTKLGKAADLVAADHKFEVSIEEQVACMVCNGLAMAGNQPQLNVISTFSAFYEGIAREALEMWRYQRNLNGVNEGLNVCYHLSHVGSCTGRDHFSGWSLDWITLGLGYLPYLDRFYTPADARAAFIAVCDTAARYGGHLVGIPRDKLPILTKADGSALWEADSEWEPTTALRTTSGAKQAILAVGATAYLAIEAAEQLTASGTPTDAYVVNGFPIPEQTLAGCLSTYSKGIVTIEDGIIGRPDQGLRGFASIIAGLAGPAKVPTAHVGIVDPRIAPADGHLELWEYFGLTTEALIEAVESL